MVDITHPKTGETKDHRIWAKELKIKPTTLTTRRHRNPNDPLILEHPNSNAWKIRRRKTRVDIVIGHK